MIKKLTKALVTAGVIAMPTLAVADTTEDLVNALVTKGVLTEDEGALLSKTHAKKEAGAMKLKNKSGLAIESADGSTKLNVAGRVQLDSRGQSNNDSADTFDIRRVYLGVDGKVANYYEYKVVGNFGSATTLDEAFVNFNWFKPMQFQFGQFKTPMSLEERTSSRFTNFMERSFVNNSSITTGKEQGAMVHGNVTDWMGYGVAVVTGLGQNVDGTNAANDNNQYIGHIDANFAKPLGYKNQVMHIGLNSSYWDADEANTGAFESAQTTLGKGSKFFKLSANGADQLVKQTWGLEGAYAYDNFKVQSEYAVTEFDTGAQTQDLSAWYADAGWLISGENYSKAYKTSNMGGKFDRIKPGKNFDPKTFSGGAWEVVAGLSGFDATDFTSTTAGYKVTTGVNEATAWRTGLNFIPQENTRIMLNYQDTDYEGGTFASEKGEQTLMMRVQFDF